MGPADFLPATGIDVRPHPHIGLATVTYLFEGEIVHRDNLGFVQPIEPGAINWMTAGRGIAHSERTGARDATGGLAAPRRAALGGAAAGARGSRARRSTIIRRDASRDRRRRRDASACSPATPTGPRRPCERFRRSSMPRRGCPRAASCRCRPDRKSARPSSSRATSRAAATRVEAPRMIVFDAGIEPRVVTPSTDARRDAARRRSARRRAPPLVELRVEQHGADRAGEAGLGGRPVRADPRRDRVHSAAGHSPQASRGGTALPRVRPLRRTSGQGHPASPLPAAAFSRRRVSPIFSTSNSTGREPSRRPLLRELPRRLVERLVGERLERAPVHADRARRFQVRANLHRLGNVDVHHLHEPARRVAPRWE